MPASLFYYGPLVKRLRQRPLTPLTWVRFPHGSPKYSSLAQLVEHAAVNRRVVGSSPTGGATASERTLLCSDFCLHKNQSPAPSFLLIPKKSVDFSGALKVRFAPFFFVKKKIRLLPCFSSFVKNLMIFHEFVPAVFFILKPFGLPRFLCRKHACA